jgi:hypothetical protein
MSGLETEEGEQTALYIKNLDTGEYVLADQLN